VFSVSKGVASTVIHRLVERGLFSYDTRIAEAWPEFGANGKDTITLRHALDHTSGLANMPQGVGIADLADWDTMCAALAAERPISKPGAMYQYHPVTFGWIIGEFARRVDGRSFSRMLDEEVRIPLGVEDALFIGMPEGEHGRVAALEDPQNDNPPPDDGKPCPAPVWLHPLHKLMNRLDAQMSCVPATSGVMTAEAVARHYAALLPGGANGVELLPPARVAEITGKEPPTLEDSRRLGYQVLSASGGGATIGHNGHGGSVAYADVVHEFAIALARNCFTDPDSPGEVIEAVRKIFIPQSAA
jgi:CubicO group peptidase (beta-lactamase class C family)